MDLLRNYHGFKEDIETTFNDLIEEFDLELTEPYDGTFILTGKRCIIRATYDRGEIGCAFKQITDDKYNSGYQIWYVYRYLYPVRETTTSSTNGDWGSPKEQLAGYSEIIQSKFKNILNGDFSWLADYSKNENEEGQLTLFVLSLDRNHPISKKFWSGDTSWKVDAENYLKQGNIKDRETN